jgi:hypothetical protein
MGPFDVEQKPSNGRSKPERRSTDRFPIARDVRFKVLSKRQEADAGAGSTVNISSGGVLFETSKDMVPGKRVELAISWPAQLDGKCSLKLVARGRVVRCDGNKVAVEIQQYEFKTVGSNGLTI